MAERVRPAACAWACAAAALLIAGSSASAQKPTLRIETGNAAAVVEGVDDGGAAYPLRAIERLGGWVLEENASVGRAVLLGDTLVFRPASPFFQADGLLHQLARSVAIVDGAVLVPAQFFVEWLPSRHAGRLAWIDGTLRSLDPVAVPPATYGNDGRASGTAEPPGTRDVAPPAAQRRAAAPPAARAGSDATTPASAAAAGSRPTTPLVVIDAGHGGEDTGKIGPNGLREKDATLAIAKRLAEHLEARGYETRMTRTTDTLIALADRPALANEWRAGRPAIFLSIHANAFTSARVKGFETFFLSDARTDDERRVAEMENESAQYEDRPAASTEVDLILNEIRNDFYVRASNDLAEAVQGRIATFHTGPNRGVKRAGFRVLVGALMPAVLIEVAFISNPEEARLLKTSAFQEKVVQGIGDAVDGFFAQNGHLWAAGTRAGGVRR